MKRGSLFFWTVLFAGIVMAPLYIFGAVMLARYGGLSQDFGWTAVDAGGHWRVASVAPDGPVANLLRSSDRITAVNSDQRAALLGPFHVLRVAPSGGSYTVSIERASRSYHYQLPLPVRWRARQLVPSILLFLASLLFFVVGSVIGLLKPQDRMPRLLTIATLAIGPLLLGSALRPSSVFFRGLEVPLYLVFVSVYPWNYLLGFRFINRFASNDMPSRAWLFIERGLIVWGLLVFVPRTIMGVLTAPGVPGMLDIAWSHQGVFTAYQRITAQHEGAFAVTTMVMICASLTTNYRRMSDPDLRRRLHWIVAGILVGQLPLALVLLARVVLISSGYRPITETQVFELLYRVTNGLPILIPLAFAYAVVRHRLLDVRVVIRRGVQYLLATNVLRAILALPVLVLVFRIVENPNQTVGDMIFGPSNSVYLTLIVASGLSLRYRRQLREWIDRRFFREAYNLERILLGLIDQIRDCGSIDEVARLMGTEIGSALHPASIHLFYRDPDQPKFVLGYSSRGGNEAVVLDERQGLVALMTRCSVPLELTRAHREELPALEREFLDALGVDLVVPVQTPERRLSGLLLLGPKRSEEPYSPADRRMLAAIASQVAIVQENLGLKARVERDRQMRQDVIARLDATNVSLLKECPACGACYDSTVEACSADGAELNLTLPVERTIDARYRLDRLVGKGGMGAVYEAVDLRLKRQVAVKIMMGSLFGDRLALRRFEREARAAAALAHPHIVAVYDYGRLAAEGAYLVMEFASGRTWRSELQRRVAAPPHVLSIWIDQVLDGLTAAHEQGVVHRDLKPENLVIIGDSETAPVVKILDFGLAKMGAAEMTVTGTMTGPGAVLGTYGYMSPEQLSGQAVDKRTDLFAIGVIVFETLTGERPFTGETFPALFHSMLEDEPHLPGDGEPLRRLDSIVQRCLAKDPRDRVQSAPALRAELVPALRECQALPRSGKGISGETGPTPR